MVSRRAQADHRDGPRGRPRTRPEFLLSGLKLDGHEALRIGLVRQIHPRKQLAEATDAHAAKMAEAVITANQDLLVSNRCHDFREGTRAFLEKRAPRFRGD